MRGFSLDQQIALLQGRRTAAEVQKDNTQARLQRVLNAKTVRPLYLPLSFDYTAVANQATKTLLTDSVDFPLLVVGLISTIQTYGFAIQIRNLVSNRGITQDQIPLPYVAGYGGVYATPGFNGVRPFSPIRLNPGNRLSVTLLNRSGLAADLKGMLCFVCLRVFPQDAAEAQLGPGERAEIDRIIATRPEAQDFFLQLAVPYVSGGTATETLTGLFTQAYDEPLLVVGCSRSLYRSTVELSDSNGYLFSSAAMPVSGLANVFSDYRAPYLFFPKPFYLPANTRLRGNFVNRSPAPGAAAWDDAGDLIFLCETL